MLGVQTIDPKRCTVYQSDWASVVDALSFLFTLTILDELPEIIQFLNI